MRDIKRSAEISDDGKFRWWLQRRWAEGPLVCFVMLNPSVADAEQDDPTIRRCMAFARDWGFGALSVRNLYPYRATKPKDLKAAMRSIDVTGGDRGHGELLVAKTADLVIAAWGANASEGAAQRFVKLTDPKPIWCLGLTKDGIPAHPLFQPSDAKPLPFARCTGLEWSDSSALPSDVIQKGPTASQSRQDAFRGGAP